MQNILTYELSDGIATISLDDGKANVMSVRMLAGITDALDRALAEHAGAVVLTGRAGMFSGGFDLSVFKTDQAELYRMLVAGARITEKLLAYPIPVVTACSGHAIAMGIFLMLSTDVRIGVDLGAKLHINEVANGMILPYFAIEVCRQRLTPAHLTLAITTALPYSPQTAVTAGFLDEIVPADALAATARSRALQLAKLHPEAFPVTKQRLREPTLVALRAAIEADMSVWQKLFASAQSS
jgi:enoyl-CoA hydratase